MSLPPHYIPPYVEIELDTAVPQIAVEATVWVLPPNELVAKVTVNEPMGWASLSFTDAVLGRHELGFQQVSDTELDLRMSVEGIVGGWGTLNVEVADTVGNRTLKNVAVFINKLVLLDVDLEIGPSLEALAWASHGLDVLYLDDLGLDVGFDVDHGLDVVTLNGFGVDLWVDVDHGFEVLDEFDKGLDVKGEMTNA